MAKPDSFKKILLTFRKFGLKLSATQAKQLIDTKLSSEGKLADGTSIYSETDFAQGKEVFTQDAEGNAVPAKPGEYKMEDGSIIVVDDKGMIAEVKAKKADEIPAEMTADEILPLVTEMGEKLETATAELKTEKEAHELLKAELAKMKVDLAALKETNVKLLRKAAGEGGTGKTKIELDADDDLTPAQKELAARKKTRELIDQHKTA